MYQLRIHQYNDKQITWIVSTIFTPTLTSSCLTKVSNNGCITIMVDKTYLPICLSVWLSVRPSSVYFYKVLVNQTGYELTKLGTSWPNQVRVDLWGTSWPNNGYKLTKNGYELTKVQVDYGKSWPVTVKIMAPILSGKCQGIWSILNVWTLELQVCTTFS